MNSQPSTDNSDGSVPIVHLRPQPLPADVAERIPQVFPSASDAVAHRLSQLRSEDSQLFGDRIIRCIVFCTSHYPAVGIDHWIEQARIDYRDLIVAAEYDRADNHLRDFNRPFRDEDFSTTNRNA
jgi:hypothetical protein